MSEIPGKYDMYKLFLYLKDTKDSQKSMESSDYDRIKEAIDFNKNDVIESARDLYKLENEISKSSKFNVNKFSNPSYKELVSNYKKTKNHIVELGEQISDIYRILPEGNEKNDVASKWSDFSTISDKLILHFENYMNKNTGFAPFGTKGGVTFSKGDDIGSALMPFFESGLLDERAVKIISEKYSKIIEEMKRKGARVDKVGIIMRSTDKPIDPKEMRKMMDYLDNFDTDDEKLK